MPFPYSATNLSGLVTTEPKSSGFDAQGNGEPVAYMDDSLREYKVCARGSVHIDPPAEHSGDGQHIIKRGTTAARPAAGKAGRFYLNTDAEPDGEVLQRDNGSSWATVEIGDYSTRTCGAYWPSITRSTNPVNTTETSGLDPATGGYMCLFREYLTNTQTYLVYFNTVWGRLNGTASGATMEMLHAVELNGFIVGALEQTNFSMGGNSETDARRLRTPISGAITLSPGSTGWHTLGVVWQAPAATSSMGLVVPNFTTMRLKRIIT